MGGWERRGGVSDNMLAKQAELLYSEASQLRLIYSKAPCPGQHDSKTTKE